MTCSINACLRAIAERAVVAFGVGEACHAAVVVFVAQWRCRVSAGILAWLAIGDRVAGLAAVAEQTVIAIGIYGNVVTGVGDLVARVNRTSNSVVAIDVDVRLTTIQRIARFGAVTEQTVIAVGVIGDVVHDKEVLNTGASRPQIEGIREGYRASAKGQILDAEWGRIGKHRTASGIEERYAGNVDISDFTICAGYRNVL